MIPPIGKFGPGSFTKNFAWHGTGLLALHEGIRTGFSGQLSPVPRDDFRKATNLDDAKFLLAANFFLANVILGGRNVIPVDELVRHAVSEPHSVAFDKLGLFVLNLSLGGKRMGVNGVEFPAPWANAFVKQALWQNGRWQRSALHEVDMDTFLSAHIQGVSGARAKVRSNYRHLFELTKLIPSVSPEINAQPAAWMAPALFTAWDRRALVMGTVGHPPVTPALVMDSDKAEDWKLLGISRQEFVDIAPTIADQYVQAGGVDRFTSVSAVVPGPAAIVLSNHSPLLVPAVPRGGKHITSPISGAPKPPVSPDDLSWLAASSQDAVVDRQLSNRFAQKRDRVLAVKMKALYKHECMVCGQTVIVGLDPELRYSEAAHIKPLGKPHDGPDKAGNLIVLCPSHHLQLDRGVISLRFAGGGKVEIISRISGDPYHQRVLALHKDHQLDQLCVEWHSITYAGVGA